MSNRKNSLKLVLLIATIQVVWSQQDHQSSQQIRFKSIEIRGHSGSHFYSGKTLTTELDAGYGALEFRYAWHSRDSLTWEAYGYPSYGIGIYTGFIGDPQIFGNPNALFGFIEFPVNSRKKRNTFAIQPALGLTYHLNPFDPENNPLNDAISARMAVYFNLGFEWAFKWTHDMDITYGLDFTHFSNGRTHTPNYGLNMFGLNLGLKYHYRAGSKYSESYSNSNEPVRFSYERSKKIKSGPANRKQSINFYAAIGTVQNEEGDVRSRFTTSSFVLDYEYQFNGMHGLTLGADYFTDPSLEVQYPDESGAFDIWAVHGGYEFMFWRLSVQFQAGFYVTDHYSKLPYFVRPAIRYNIADWAYAQVGLKTEGFAADWVEFGIGFKPFKW